jgi:Mor family transcriptional regulator
MPPPKLTPDQRRGIVLSALSGESKAQLAKRYDVARSWIYTLVNEALDSPENKVREAEREAAFRRRVARMAKDERRKG